MSVKYTILDFYDVPLYKEFEYKDKLYIKLPELECYVRSLVSKYKPYDGTRGSGCKYVSEKMKEVKFNVINIKYNRYEYLENNCEVKIKGGIESNGN